MKNAVIVLFICIINVFLVAAAGYIAGYASGREEGKQIERAVENYYDDQLDQMEKAIWGKVVWDNPLNLKGHPQIRHRIIQVQANIRDLVLPDKHEKQPPDSSHPTESPDQQSDGTRSSRYPAAGAATPGPSHGQ